MQLVTMAHVGAGAPPSEVPLDAALDAPEEEPAPEELEAPLPDDRPTHGELQLRSAHWIKPLQSKLVQLEAAMHVLSADEQPLLTHALHFEVSVMPVTTETKASGSLQPPVLEFEPPLLVPEPFEVEPELEPALPPRSMSGPILPVPLPELAPHATTNPNPISPITDGCCMTSSSTASLRTRPAAGVRSAQTGARARADEVTSESTAARAPPPQLPPRAPTLGSPACRASRTPSCRASLAGREELPV